MPELMSLKPTTVRFARDGAELIEQAAAEVGSTVAQFVREAALMRAVIVLRDKDRMTRFETHMTGVQGDDEERAATIKRLARRDDRQG